MLEWLYYQEKSEEAVYSSNPPGQPVVERFINGEDKYWQKDDISPNMQKCKLVLSDWSAVGWDIDKVNQVKSSLKTVLDKGFQVMAWQKGELITINLDNLGLLDDAMFRNNMYCQDPSDMSRSLTKKGIAADEVKNLDYLNTKRLCSEALGVPSQVEVFEVRLSDFVNCSESYQKLGLYDPNYQINLSRACGEELRKVPLKVDVCGGSAPLFLDAIKKNNSSVQIYETIDRVNFQGMHSDSLESKDISADQLSEIIFVTKETDDKALDVLSHWIKSKEQSAAGEIDNTLRLAALKKLELLKHGEDIPDELIRGLLGQSNLEQLKLFNFGIRTFDETLFDQTVIQQLNSLKKLDLEAVNVELSCLMNILANSKELLELNLNMVNMGIEASDEFKFRITEIPMALYNLQNLKFSHGICFPKDVFQDIIAKAINIKHLDLDVQDQGIFKDLFSWLWFDDNPQALSALETLNVHGYEMFSYEQSKSILQRATNIRSIIDRGSFCNGIDVNWMEDNPNALIKVEELSTYQSNITPENLLAFCQRAQSLTSLKLDTCKNLENKLEDTAQYQERLTLDNLQELKLTNFTPELFQLLLGKALNLKTFDLSHCNNLNSCVDNHWAKSNLGQLQQLEKLNLAGSDINIASLLDFVGMAPNIKVLNLSRCTNLNEEIIKYLKDSGGQLQVFESLEELDLSDSNITTQGLSLLLNAFPNIKKLNLHNCTKLFEDKLFSGTFPYLNSLEQLNLSDTKITTDQLSEILKNITHLKDLNISSCHNNRGIFDRDFIEQHISKLSSLETITANNTGLRTPLLEQFLLSCPQIKNLHLRGCDIQNDWLMDMIKVNPDLFHNLENFTTYRNTSAELLLEIMKNSPNLEGVDLSGCYSIRELLELPWFDPYRRIMHSYPQSHSSSYSAGKSSTSDRIHSKNNNSCDINTENQHQEFNIQRIFFAKDGNHPYPSYYRNNCWNNLHIKPEPNGTNPFVQFNQDELDLIYVPINIAKSSSALQTQWQTDVDDNSDCYYGCVEFADLSTDWQPIPSLSPNEKISQIYVHGLDSYEIKYSKRDNQYYILDYSGDKAPNRTIKVEYLVEVPKNDLGAENAPIENSKINESGIRELIKECRSFGEGKLKVESDNPTGQDYLQAMIEQKVGACRHRAVAFKAQMQEKYPDVPVRMVNNGIHAFVEIKLNDQWSKVCLGGHPADLTINETNKPDESIDENLVAEQQEQLKLLQKRQQERLGAGSFATVKEMSATFKTWESSTEKSKSFEEYTQHILTHYAGQNALIEMQSNQDVEAYNLILQQACKTQDQEVFYIDKPEDINCSAKWVKREANNLGQIMKGPGGALHDFLTKKHNNPPVIIINWTNFESDDIARFNSIIDDIDRKADGTLVPEKAHIIGLYNVNRENAYKRADFYGRFHNQDKRFPFDGDELSQKANILLKAETEGQQQKENHHVIELFASKYWKQALLGQWLLKGDELVYKPGKLEIALEKGGSVEIKNGPWDNAEFRQFWQQTLIQRKVQFAGKTIQLQDDFNLIKTQGYALEQFNQVISWQENIESEDITLLNPNAIGQFYESHLYDEKNKTLTTSDGLIKQNKNKTLNIKLTRNISDEHWYKLLDNCAKHHVKLNIIPSIDLKCPEGIAEPPFSLATLSSESYLNTNIIETSDIDYTVASITHKDKAAKVIDVSEMDGGRLLDSYNLQWKDELQFGFEKRYGALWQALKNGEHIILKGELSDDLVDRLAPLCLPNAYLIEGNHKIPFTGKLTLVSRDTRQLNHFLQDVVEKQEITLEEKLKLLKEKGYEDSHIQRLVSSLNESSNPNLSQLETQLKYLTAYPNSSLSETWYGYQDLKAKYALGDSLDLTRATAEKFELERERIVQKTLSYNPFVFLAGATGVGKSTFIKKNLDNDPNYEVFPSTKQIKDWALAKDPSKTQVLFIDEANLEHTDFSVFEGLYNEPPSVIIDGEYYELTEQHKVIFAGNPLSYGAGRHLASLFERHASAVVFDPLNSAYIYHKILMPLLNKQMSENEIQTVGELYLSVYQYMCAQSRDTVLMTPREVEMMAMMTLSAAQDDNIVTFAKQAAFTIGRNVLPPEKISHFENWFDNKFSLPETPEITLPGEVYEDENILGLVGDFVLTPSRLEAYNGLNDIINVRAFQQKTKIENQKRAGLGGIILEGEPGDGKSHFAMAFLKSKGFKQVDPSEIARGGDVFCHLPASMSLTQKRECLIAAFHAGAVVIEDEMNSCPSLEKLRNNLLMGLDENGKPADKPGLKFIGTGNPIDFAGRKATSLALKRRTIKCDVPSYTENEMISIIKHNCPALSHRRVIDLVDDYTRARNYAITHNKQPKPSFRRLLKVAKLRENLYRDEPLERVDLHEDKELKAAASTASKSKALQDLARNTERKPVNTQRTLQSKAKSATEKKKVVIHQFKTSTSSASTVTTTTKPTPRLLSPVDQKHMGKYVPAPAQMLSTDERIILLELLNDPEVMQKISKGSEEEIEQKYQEYIPIIREFEQSIDVKIEFALQSEEIAKALIEKYAEEFTIQEIFEMASNHENLKNTIRNTVKPANEDDWYRIAPLQSTDYLKLDKKNSRRARIEGLDDYVSEKINDLDWDKPKSIYGLLRVLPQFGLEVVERENFLKDSPAKDISLYAAWNHTIADYLSKDKQLLKKILDTSGNSYFGNEIERIIKTPSVAHALLDDIKFYFPKGQERKLERSLWEITDGKNIGVATRILNDDALKSLCNENQIRVLEETVLLYEVLPGHEYRQAQKEQVKQKGIKSSKQ